MTPALGARVAVAARWSLLNTVVIRIGTFATGVVLARYLLGPREWGLYAVGLVVLSVLLSANEMGVSLALVRWESGVRSFAPTVLSLSVASSVLLYAILYAAAPVIARLLGSGDATMLLRVLCFAVVIDGIACVPAGVLTRDFAQRSRMAIDLANFVISTGVTIALAIAGAGAISFAWGAVAGNATALAGAAIAAPGMLRFGWDRAQARALVRFGLPLAGASLLVLAMLNVDSAVVGATLGPAALGLYQVAFNVSSWPVRSVSEVARRVSFAGFSRVAGSRESLADGFARALGLLMAAAVPACVLLGVLAGPLVRTIYGPRWDGAATVLQFLAVLGLARVAFELAYDCLSAAGRRTALLLVQGWWLVALVPVLIVLARRYGIAGVGAGHVLVAVTLVAPAFLVALAGAGITARRVARACARPFVGGAVCAAVAVAVHAASGDTLLGLAAAISAASVAYLFIIVPVRSMKRWLRRAFGWARLREIRNRTLLAATVPALRRREDAEVRRLARMLRPARAPALVATVIPTYRRPEALRRAVASALAQTIQDHVVIVVDDGGGPPDLPPDPRLIAVSLSSNVGVAGVVRNIGIRLTDSRYVAFLDDDNTWAPTHLAVALAHLQPEAPGAERADGVYTALRRMEAGGAVRDILSVPFDRRHAADRCFLDTNAFVARRTPGLRFSRLRRDRDVMPREDWELIFRFSRANRVVHVPVVTVDYTVNPDSYFTAWTP